MKLIQYNYVNIVIMLIIVFTADTLGMRMTEAGKEKARKFLQQQQLHQEQQRQEKLKNAIIPFGSFKQIPAIKPVIFYEQKNKKITLKFVENNKLKETVISPTQVKSYNFSPQKKYLVFQTTITGIAKSESWTEKLKTQTLEKISGYKIGEKLSTSNLIKIIDLQTQKEVGSFDGELITYEFSPDENTLLISRRHMGKKLSDKGTLPLGSRPQNDTTRYELFDIASQSTLKTFENVQAINYTSEDTLMVQYDNELIEKITIQKTLSSAQKIMNMFRTQFPTQVSETVGNIQDISKKITYYDAIKELYVSLPNRKQTSYANITAYMLSPLKNYLILMKDPATMSLVNMTTGQVISDICTNTITYEFSPDEKETRLIALASPRELFSGKNLLYSLIKLEKDRANSLTTFDTDNAFYFASANEFVLVNKNDIFTPYDAQTGLTFEQEQHQKRKQIVEEIKQKENIKEKSQKQEEQQQQKLQNQLEKTQLEKSNKKEEELIQQQQEYQKYYEESPSVKPEKSFFERAKQYLQSFWSTTQELPPVEEKKEIVLPLLKEKKETEEEFFEPEEDIDDWMSNFSNNKEQDNVTKIITKLSKDDDQDDRDELLKQYNNYNDATKKQFASYFFAAPNGALETIQADGKDFIADIVGVEDSLQITNKSSQKMVFRSEKPFENDVKTMVFSAHDDYLALSFESPGSMKIFAKEKNSNSFGLSQSLDLTDFAPIIGIKCITTSNNKTYFFFIDANYKMGVCNPDAEVFSLKSTSKKKT